MGTDLARGRATEFFNGFIFCPHRFVVGSTNVFIFIHLATTPTGTQPYVVVWNLTSYGPDGPWQVVTVEIGGSKVNLYPSGIWETIVNSDAMCNGTGTCLAAAAGLYDEANSQSVVSNFTDTTEALGRWGSGAASKPSFGVNIPQIRQCIELREFFSRSIDLDTLPYPNDALKTEDADSVDSQWISRDRASMSSTLST